MYHALFDYSGIVTLVSVAVTDRSRRLDLERGGDKEATRSKVLLYMCQEEQQWNAQLEFCRLQGVSVRSGMKRLGVFVLGKGLDRVRG